MDQAQLDRAVEDVQRFIQAQKGKFGEFGEKQAELQARLQEAEQKLARRGGGGEHASGGGGPSLGREVEAAFRENSELFGKTRTMTLAVNATITSDKTGSRGSLGAPSAPAQVSTQTIGRLRPAPLNGLQSLIYARRTGVTGAAVAQDAEAAAKAVAEPVFTSITQNAITVAGYAVVSEQALKTDGGLQRAVDSHLTKSVRDAADAILISGTAATGWPFAGFVALAATFTSATGFTTLADAILSGALRMRLQGFSPDIVVLPEAGFLAVQLAKDTTNAYLAANYVPNLSLALGGMTVCLSSGVPSNKALLLDSAFCGLLAADSTTVTLGYTDTQFKQNLITVRAETAIIPTFFDYQGAMLVTPSPT